MKKIVPIVLLVVGLLLLYVGYEEYQAFRSEADQFFGGTGSDRAILMIIVGAAGLLREKTI